MSPTMLRLHVWWANLCHRVFEAAHEPADDGFSFRELLDDGLDWSRAYFHLGHLVMDTTVGRQHFDDRCPCVRDAEHEAARRAYLAETAPAGGVPSASSRPAGAPDVAFPPTRIEVAA